MDQHLGIMLQCPCGSKAEYNVCCGAFINKNQRPDTPEQLMRSRYTAYTQHHIEYIQQTMRGPALLGFNKIEAKAWSQKVIWVKLEVIKSSMESDDKGFVEFIASFLDKNQLNFIHEISEFRKENNQWFYVDGTHQPSTKNKRPLGRTSPCPCGSGRKFKNCHEQR